MASTKDYPENHVAWFIVGDKLAIVTTDGSDASSVHSKYSDWKAINESVTDGVLIHYYAEPNAVSAITDSIDLDNTLHPAIVNFVVARLMIDRVSHAKTPDMAAVYMNVARIQEREYAKQIRRYGVKKRDKIGGPRRILPPNLT